MKPSFLNLESDVPEKELVPGFHARLIHTDQVTIGHVHAVKGSILLEHQHPHQQVTNVISGELSMTVAGETKLCKAGDSIVIPGTTPHAAEAITDCYLIDVFHPVREDYK
ncbi:MAG: cupin domain-containing protein [Phaeodactylibacter sp.]|nr:cupin domain-containing protein [Phaeodactylibacter sp.]